MDVHQYTLEEVMEITQNFNTQINSGGFANVFQGRINRGTTSEEVVAVKVYQKSATTQKEFDAEKGCLLKFQHENILKMKGYAEDDLLILVLEYIPIPLSTVIENLNWQDTLRILKQLASALEYIHRFGDVLMDFKPDNIMIDEEKRAKIIDLGSILKGGQCTKSYSKGYAAPEVELKFGKPTQKADVYSFGVVMLQLMRKMDEVEPGNKKNIHKGRGKGKRLTTHISMAAEEEFKRGDGHYVHKTLLGSGDNCSKEDAKQITILALHCTKRNANSRPTMQDVVRRLSQF